jgi:hypothetical protein
VSRYIISFIRRFVLEVLRMRVDLFAQFREQHGERIKLDRAGSTSVETSIKVRTSWARGDWMAISSNVLGSFNSPDLLRKWHVLQSPGGPSDRGGCGGQGGSGDRAGGWSGHKVDGFLLETLETLARIFAGLLARTMMLWAGGVYNVAMTLSGDPGERAQATERASQVWRALLRFEEVLCVTDATDELHDFAGQFLWMDGTVYRELFASLAEGRVEFARDYAWRVHGGVCHEKGHQQHFCS